MRIREAVGVFRDLEGLRSAIEALHEVGFEDADFAVMTTARTLEQQLGHLYESVDHRASSGMPRRHVYTRRQDAAAVDAFFVDWFDSVGATPLVGTVVASSGPLATTLAAATAREGDGNDLNATLSHLFGQPHARNIADEIDRDGLLLWVRTSEPAQDRRAARVLLRQSGHHVRIHDLATLERPTQVAC